MGLAARIRTPMSQSNRITMSGDEFRKIRMGLGLGRDAFAMELGYEGGETGNVNTIKRFENNKRPVPLPVAKLAWMLSAHGLPEVWPEGLLAAVSEETAI